MGRVTEDLFVRADIAAVRLDIVKNRRFIAPLDVNRALRLARVPARLQHLLPLLLHQFRRTRGVGLGSTGKHVSVRRLGAAVLSMAM